MEPYYNRGNISIFHGDAREIVPQLAHVDAVITDPVWPNPLRELTGSDDPLSLWHDVARHFPWLCKRYVIILGCYSDPRFLSSGPISMAFLRVQWLRYAWPSYRGRVLNGADVAYAFGAFPSTKVATVIPGEVTISGPNPKSHGHPTERRLIHMKWLVRYWAEGTVVDPFCGSGTTAVACKEMGIPFVGVEIEEKWCEVAAKRLAQEVLAL